VPRAAIAGLALEDPEWIMPNVERHTDPLAEQAQFAIANAGDHGRRRSFTKPDPMRI
jgi:hypothetical protein